ncbi:hypothetical protein EWB00_006641 [Schistosoma japonicum]|uniref:Uncharacterized protein n=1 Tax=Schistosoma japonicum TaxID=6182 RepID=A0A4Z2CXG4_SCHJA|nr:hypothetical protein EWB00_006641 [Schistosoma japonicum]
MNKLNNSSINLTLPIYRFQVIHHNDINKSSINCIQQTMLLRNHSINDKQSSFNNIELMYQKINDLLHKMKKRHSIHKYQRKQTYQYYVNRYDVDSGGNVHGPMDQRHTARLGNISRSGQYIPGSRYYLSENVSTERFKRRQSDSGAWDAHSEIHNHNVHNTFRSRTYSETRRLNDYSDDLYRSSKGNTTTTRYHYSNQQPHFKTTASHNISRHSPQSHISRWSSMQTAGTQGLWRGTNSGRYATTLTRQHIKKHHDPVEMVVKHTPSGGASRVDLLSVDNRQGSLPHLANYSINTNITEREQKLQNELLNTQRELQQLKRSRSLTGEQNLSHSTTLKHTLKSGSSQYLNEGYWTTYSLKKNDGQPCGARIAGK